MIKRIARQFDLTYIKPDNVLRAMQYLTPRLDVPVQQRPVPKRRDERRCGIERRQARAAILLDLRCSYARRNQLRRHGGYAEHGTEQVGIDIFV